MPGESKRSVLSELKKPLLQPPTLVPAALEEHLLGTATAPYPATKPGSLPPEAEIPPEPPISGRRSKTRVPTVPVTFHLPVELRDRIKITAQAKQKTMVDLAIEAFADYLGRNPVSEADLRRLLGLS
jgi:hypothetical protein